MLIKTVTGDIKAKDIHGPVLPHEHLAIDLRRPGDTQGYLTDVAPVANELHEAKQRYGLGLVVDQTARGMGRDVEKLRLISQQAEVPIVAATGWYYSTFHPSGELTDIESALDLLRRDITIGIDGTEVKAGVIGEIGTHAEQPTPTERVSFLAAGRAAKQYNLPLSTHAALGKGVAAQLELLTESGVDFSRVSIGHQDLFANTEQHKMIAETGAYVAFDTVGKSSYQSDDTRIQLLIALLELGHERNILLSNDISRYGYLVSEGGTGYSHVLGTFAGRLRDIGIDDATLDLLYRRNPLRWLSGAEID